MLSISLWSATRKSVRGTKYSVIASVKCEDQESYVNWLQNGHVQAVCKAGATSARILVHEGIEDGRVKIEAMYFFANRDSLQQYLDVSAPLLREEGKKLWIDTNKAIFTRSISNIVFSN